MRSLVTRNQPGQAGYGITTLSQEMDRLFADAFGDFLSPSTWPAAGTEEGLLPAVDVAETDKTYEITADMPGLAEKDIALEVNDNVLTLKGERKTSSEQEGKNFFRTERRSGMFQRSFTLPQHVDQENIEAIFKNGVLHVTLPKIKEHKSVKKIAVKGD